MRCSVEVQISVVISILSCVLLSPVWGDEVQDREQSVLKAVLAARRAQGSCEVPMICVPVEQCVTPGSGCDEAKVCCNPGDMVLLPVEQETSAPLPGLNGSSPDIDMRSASGFQNFDRNSASSFQSNTGNAGLADEFNPYGQPASGNSNGFPSDQSSSQNSPNFRSADGYNHGYPSPYGAAPGYGNFGPPGYHSDRVHGGYGKGNNHGNYNSPPTHFYGSFDHVYKGNYREFAPDFYGPRYDARRLSPVARNALHKYRFREQCGLRPVGLFPKLPYPAPYDTRYRPVTPPQFAQHPWQAAVLGWSPRGYGLRCSATLVHPFLLITSAHCIRGIVEPELKVLLGVSDLLARAPFIPAVERAVGRVFVHEQFDPDTLAHDVALLQLAEPVNLHFTPHVAKACLPLVNQTFVATNCYIVGWTNPSAQKQAYGGFPSNQLQTSEMKFVGSNKDCQQEVSQFARSLNPNELTAEMHCIKAQSDATCLGSAGAALFCDVDSAASSSTSSSSHSCTGHGCPGSKTYLAGIVSWSNEKCGTDGLAVITELSPYVPWINDLLAQAGGLQHFDPHFYGHLGGGAGHGYGSPGGHGHGHSGYGSSGGYSHGSDGGYGSSGGYGHGGYGSSGGYGHGGYGSSGGYGHGGYGSSGGYGHGGYGSSGGYGHGGYGSSGGYGHGDYGSSGGYGHGGYGSSGGYGHGGYGSSGGYGQGGYGSSGGYGHKR